MMTPFGSKSSPSAIFVGLLIKLNFFFYKGWSAKLLSQNQTMLTLHTQQVTWLEACAVCQSLGGSLLNMYQYGIDDESTGRILQNLLKTDPWKANLADNEGLWTGLYKDDTGNKTLQWSDACGRGNISARSVLSATLQCLSLVGGASWVPRPCDFKLKFICEQESDLPCTFAASRNKYDFGKFLSSSKKMTPSKENCMLHCWNQNTCGYVVYYSFTGICIVMTPAEHEHATSDFGWLDKVAYKKICANASVIIYPSTDMYSLPEVSHTPVELGVSNIPINTDGNTFPESTFDESTNNISNFTDSTVTVSNVNESTKSKNNVNESTVSVNSVIESTNNYVVVSTVSLNSVDEGTGNMNTMVLNTTDASTNNIKSADRSTVVVNSADDCASTKNNADKSTVDLRTSGDFTSGMTTANGSTVEGNKCAESTDDINTAKKNKQCYCKCNVTSMSADRKLFLDQLLQPLNVNLSTLSSTRRKYVCVKDQRPSARNVGFVGAVLLFGSLLVLPMLDCVSLLGVLYPRFCRLTREWT